MKKIREEDGLKEKSKGKTKEGATELLTMGDLQSHRKMFNLLKNTFPDVTVSLYDIIAKRQLYVLCLCSVHSLVVQLTV